MLQSLLTSRGIAHISKYGIIQFKNQQEAPGGAAEHETTITKTPLIHVHSQLLQPCSSGCNWQQKPSPPGGLDKDCRTPGPTGFADEQAEGEQKNK